MREVVFNTEDKIVSKNFRDKIRSDAIASRVDGKKYKEKPKAELVSRMNNEIRCLTTLQENFINEPEINHYPFPKLLSYKDYTLKLTYCGESMDHIFLRAPHGAPSVLGIKKDYSIKISTEYLNKTIECIINNLTVNNILHGDLHHNNICINDNNIYLIDFDRPYDNQHVNVSRKLVAQRHTLRLIGWDLLFLQNNPQQYRYIWYNEYNIAHGGE